MRRVGPTSAVAALALASLTIALSAAVAVAQDVLVVTPREFAPALDAWKQHRKAQGLGVVVKEPGDDVAATVRAVHRASEGKLRFVMLVGDVEHVPCAWSEAQSIGGFEGFGIDEKIPNDNALADFDGDSLPDVAIGRVPADTPEEARAYLARVVAYEQDRDFGTWRRRLNVVAGTGGFGPLQDAALETLTKQFLTRNVPPSVEVTATYANVLSPWCPPPAEFADYTVRRYSEGALVVAYVGHGSARSVDRVRLRDQSFPILGAEEVKRIDAAHGAPVAVFIACSTGKLDGPADCLAEDLLRRPRGPIAVIASSRVSTPYSNGVISKELLDSLYSVRAVTTGELLVSVKRRLRGDATGDAAREQLEKMAAAFYDKSDERRTRDRIDHLALYNLFGDPTARIAHPQVLEISAPAEIVAGSKARVAADVPYPGRALVELVARRDTRVDQPPVKRTAEDYRDVYERAQHPPIARVERLVETGRVEFDLEVPEGARPGEYCVRFFLEGSPEGASGAAMGGRDVTLRAAAVR